MDFTFAKKTLGRFGLRGKSKNPCFYHEIKNYSATLRANLLLLSQAMPGSPEQAPLARMTRAIANIERLLGDAMGESDPSLARENRPLCLGAVIMGCVDTYFHDRKPSFHLRIDGDVPCISGDAARLEQVFMNLFKNSLEAGATRVEVSLSKAPGGLRVLVADNGKGCGKKDLENLFELRFTTKRGEGGQGLGLYLVKAIMENHGASISPKPAPEGEGGLVFELIFPA